jgi:hypothetical protein
MSCVTPNFLVLSVLVKKKHAGLVVRLAPGLKWSRMAPRCAARMEQAHDLLAATPFPRILDSDTMGAKRPCASIVMTASPTSAAPAALLHKGIGVLRRGDKPHAYDLSRWPFARDCAPSRLMWSQLPFGLASTPPSPTICMTSGCGKPVSKPGHTLCYEHRKAARVPPAPPKSPKAAPAPAKVEPANPPLLAASALAERVGLSAQRVNLLSRDKDMSLFFWHFWEELSYNG